MRQVQPALGERAGLVGADARDAADVLDDDRAPHERLPPREPVDADAEEERQHDRELLGQRRDRERHRREQRVDEPVPLLPAHPREHRAHDGGGDDERAHELRDRLLQRRAFVAPADGRADDLAVERLAARVRDEEPRLAGQHARAREAPVPIVELRVARERPGGRGLAHRIRLAGQRGFVDLHVDGVEQHAVGGDRIARRERDDVAGHQLDGRELDPRTVAQRARGRGEPAREPGERRLRAAVEPRVHPEQRDERREQDRRLGAVAHEREQHARAEQEPQHRVAERIADDVAPAAGRRLEDRVGTVARAARDRGRRGQALFGRREAGEALGGKTAGHAVRERGAGRCPAFCPSAARSPRRLEASRRPPPAIRRPPGKPPACRRCRRPRHGRPLACDE